MHKVITQPTTEPVTLAEVKMALRLDSTEFENDISIIQSIAPDSHNIAASYSLLGTGVDVLGISALVLFESGTNGTGGTVDAKIQESDDNITFIDWTGGAFTPVTTANDNTNYEKAYTGSKRYIRVACTVAVAACEFGISVVKKASTSAEDTLLQTYITAAREFCEIYTGRALATQTLEMQMDDFPSEDYIEIGMPPLQSVTSVKYTDSTGTETTLAPTTGYIIDAHNEPGKIFLPYNISWPSFVPYPHEAVKIRFVAGYNESYPMPKSIKQAIYLLVGHWYNNREAVVVGSISKQLEFTIDVLLISHKVRWFG